MWRNEHGTAIRRSARVDACFPLLQVQLLVKLRFDVTVVVVVSQHATRSSHNRTVTAPSLGQGERRHPPERRAPSPD